MFETTVCQLLRDLERTIHERMQAIEMFIQRQAEPEPETPANSIEYSNMRSAHQFLLRRVESLEEELRDLRREKTAELIPPHPLQGIEIVPKKEIVLMEANPERISEADRLLLNSSARKALEEEEEDEEEQEAYDVPEDEDEAEDEEQQVEEAETEEVPPAAAEAAPEEEAEEAEAEAEAEAEEEAEEGLEEFEYKGATYYRDTEKNVYMTDENGDLNETPIGVWSDVKNRIIVKKPVA